jgi:hypothetical protein
MSRTKIKIERETISEQERKRLREQVSSDHGDEGGA